MSTLVLDSSHGITAYQGVLVAVWAGESREAQMTAVGDHLLRLYSVYPGRVQLFSVITETTGMPGAAVRATLKAQFERARGKLVGAAVVIEHRGILHNLSRSIITSLVTVSRQPFPLKIFSERAEAAAWLARHPGAPKSDVLIELAASLQQQTAGAAGPGASTSKA